MMAAMLAGWNSAFTSCSSRSFSLRFARLRTYAERMQARLRASPCTGTT